MKVCRRLALTLLVLAVGLSGSRPALADEAADDAADAPSLAARVAAVLEDVAAHRRAHDARALVNDIQSAVALYKEAAAREGYEKAAADLIRLAGSFCRHKVEDVRLAAIKALGQMGHSDCATYLKAYLKPVRKARPKHDKEIGEALVAAASIACPSLVRPLLAMVDKSKNYTMAGKALHALGKFGSAKRHRAKILKDLTKSLRPDMPGRPAPGKENPTTGDYIPPKAGAPGTSRWGTLAPIFVETCNELTGQQIMSAEEWFEFIQANRQNLEVIFRDDA